MARGDSLTGTKGRPRGSYINKDDDGNPIGIYDYRRLLAKKRMALRGKRIYKKLTLDLNTAKRDHAMAYYIVKKIAKSRKLSMAKVCRRIIINYSKIKYEEMRKQKRNDNSN